MLRTQPARTILGEVRPTNGNCIIAQSIVNTHKFDSGIKVDKIFDKTFAIVHEDKKDVTTASIAYQQQEEIVLKQKTAKIDTTFYEGCSAAVCGCSRSDCYRRLTTFSDSGLSTCCVIYIVNVQIVQLEGL